MTIWCVLLVNDAFMIGENSQHHFHLAPNLVCLFWPWRPPNLPLWWLDICFRVIPLDPRFTTGNYCLHEVCIMISTLQQISVHCKVSLFLPTVCNFGTNCSETCFMLKSSVRMGCSKPNESPNSSEIYLFVILHLSSILECTLLIISWFLLI